jgi:16S rRNA (guanine966-N2)-methyltransferase
MRIISGERRGHKFDGPTDSVTRPTSDMVRESIFNILGDRAEGRVVYDLFAGSGALGLEALSRGAEHAVFVEKDRRNFRLIRDNIATLRFEGRGAVVAADAYRWAQTFEAEGDAPVLVLIDPPYRDFRERPERVRAMIAALVERLPVGSTIVLEAERDGDAAVLPDIERWDIRKYSRTHIAILDLDAPEDAGEES